MCAGCPLLLVFMQYLGRLVHHVPGIINPPRLSCVIVVGYLQFFGWLPQLSNANTHRALIVLMIAGMAVVGIQNIQHQRSIKGEYSNYPMEDLIDWILEKTPEGVFKL